MPELPHCPNCDAVVPARVLDGLCPRCLLARMLPGTLTATAAAAPAPAPLGRFGDYELLAVIARGGMGVVYRARQRSLGRIVALKLIRAGEFASPDESRRFQLEAAATAQFDHPHIVAIYEVGEHGGQQFFSMQFMDGGVLKACREDGELRMDAPAAARLVAKVAHAVHYAHQHGILHRDLKPGNILLDRAGEPHVSDFGLAKRADSSFDLTLSGAILGTPSYLSPEQAAGQSKRITIAADVYGLGSILYELLTGHPPFAAATPLATLRQVMEDPPKRPSRLRARVDRDLETICLKCLEKDPAHRYAAAGALAEDLERWLRHEPIRARPAPVWEYVLKWARRKPALAALLILAAVAPALIIAVLLLSQARLHQAQARATEERNKARQLAEQTRCNLYAADMFSVHLALQSTQRILAPRTLAQYLPQPDQPEVRGFEWRWLWQQARGDARVVLPAHSNDVTTVAFAPNGRWLASAGHDGWVRVFDLSARKFVAALRAYELEPDPLSRGHDFFRAVHAVSFSPDSQFLACCAAPGTRIWRLDALSARPAELKLAGRGGLFLPTEELAISYESPLLPTSTTNLAAASQIGWFDARLQPTAPPWSVTNSVFCVSANGEWLADAGHQTVQFWNLRRRELVSTFQLTALVHRLALSPDGATLALCCRGKHDVELWDPRQGRRTGALAGHTREVSAISFSPDGRQLASSSTDETVRLWDAARQVELRQWRSQDLGAACVAFSPDGRHVASGGADGAVRLWPIEAPPPLPAISNVAPPLAFSADGQWLTAGVHPATAGSREAPALPAEQSFVIWHLATHAATYFTGAPPVAITFPAGAKEFLAALLPAPGATLELWEYAPVSGTSARRLRLPELDSPVACVALRSDGQELVTGHRDGSLRWWDAGSGQLRAQSQPYTGAVVGVRYSPNGRFLVTWTGSPRRLQAWQVATRQCLATNHFPGPAKLSFAFSPDGEECVTGGFGADARVWRTASLELLEVLPRRREAMHLLAWSPDGRTIAAATEDGGLRLWQRATGRLLLTLLELPPARGQLLDLAFSPDHQWLAACTDQGELHLWHAPAPEERERPR